MNRRKVLILLLASVVALAGGVYAYFRGKRYVFTFTEAQLREKLAERLPFKRRYFLVIEVTLDRPRITLREGTNRIHAGLDVELNLRLGGETKNLGGSLDASGALRYQPETGQFFLVEPAIERFAVQGVPEKYTAMVNSALSQALGEYYADHPIYTLSFRDGKQAAAKLLLKDVTTRDKKLIVTLGI